MRFWSAALPVVSHRMWRVGVVAPLALIALAALAGTGHAQICSNFCAPPAPSSVSANAATTTMALGSAGFDLGSQFLQSLDAHASPGFGYTLPNPGGGGASGDAPRYRTWVESYGLWSKTAAEGDFVSDTRRTLGGVGGISANVIPGGWLGVSVDQSHTNIDAPAASQFAALDLTQVGINGSYEIGQWTVSGAAIRGLGSAGTNRFTSTGPAGTSFDADIWGATGEVNYYWALGNARVVPKLGADWLRTHSAGYTESGPSLDDASVPGATWSRTRLYAGAEIGDSFMIDKTLLDLSGYARALDSVAQNAPSLLLSSATGGELPTLIQGVPEARYGLDAGATASLRLTTLTRVYVGFDSHFRDGYQAYGGTVGGEIKW
jgi:uncharacterized protein with beta-barrel porin domain